MEKYLFIAFRSREHTVKFYEYLRSRRVEGEIINTPREAAIGCGLSIKFSAKQKNAVQTALARNRYQSFIGVFSVTVGDGRKYISPLNWG